jgi:oxygen-independent coproporphyrinogen III oxidase
VNALSGLAPFAGYTYAYPHKTAYRRLPREIPLAEAWAEEPRQALFLYVHVPFCEYRCGFCNLFTDAHPRPSSVARYLDALERQCARVVRALGAAAFARFAIGGGTPTYLPAPALERILDLARGAGADAAEIPASIELSPETATAERVALLRERGIHRVSLGVQTFDEEEALALSRPQSRPAVEGALSRLRGARFSVMNVDLMYGIPGQTGSSFLDSIHRALEYRPEEIYLYPLYVRPLTGLGVANQTWLDERASLYRAGRARLLESGYTQVSLRMFRASHSPRESGPAYCCQDDGMVGLGAGARSYTRGLHWSTEWAVGRQGVRGIIDAYTERADEAHDSVAYGFRLDGDEQRRRFVIQSLLQRPGLDFGAYRGRFATDPFDDLPSLAQLEEAGWATREAASLTLTEEGLDRSDAIGPWLYSDTVRRLMEGYALR